MSGQMGNTTCSVTMPAQRPLLGGKSAVYQQERSERRLQLSTPQSESTQRNEVGRIGQHLRHVEEELRTFLAVDQSMVEREAQCGHRSQGDLALVLPGLAPDIAEAQDGRLARIDDGRAG